MKGSYPTCERNGFPKLRIDGRLQCVAEYLDRCIGQQRVIDLIERGKTTYYAFENGHELPLLCSCCGKPLEFLDLESSRRETQGRRLEVMSVAAVELPDGSQVVELRLELSKKGWLSRRTSMAVAPEAAARLRHPADCPHQGHPSTQKGRRKKRRRPNG
jgi:hypothetical protein